MIGQRPQVIGNGGQIGAFFGVRAERFSDLIEFNVRGRTTASAAMRRSREFVPLKISSTRNNTGLFSTADSIAWRSRSTSARNFDFPFNKESTMDSDAKIDRPDNRRARARTGAPANASTAFNPIARNSVLFPDIFDPLTT